MGSGDLKRCWRSNPDWQGKCSNHCTISGSKITLNFTYFLLWETDDKGRISTQQRFELTEHNVMIEN